jgi:hypothetical protein
MTELPTDEEAVAHHEAAHAVFKYNGGALGPIILQRIVLEGGQVELRAVAKTMIAGFERPSVADDAVAIAAGAVAHAKALGGGDPRDHFSPFDYSAIPEGLHDEAIRRAALALADAGVWGAVVALAAALTPYWPTASEPGEHIGTMPGEACEEIIKGARAGP